jgi:hypothetical protein
VVAGQAYHKAYGASGDEIMIGRVKLKYSKEKCALLLICQPQIPQELPWD